MKIWTDDECIEVDPSDVGELEAAMLFKAEHIKAKADTELFAAVAEMLSRLWDSTTKRVDVVRCKDCKYYCQDKINGVICRHPALDFDTECFDHWINTNPNDFCSYGEKEGADNG